MTPLPIFLGFDPREESAFQVAAKSIKARSSVPVDIIPLKLGDLGNILTRPIEVKDGRLWCPISQAPMATEFAISRFCVPFLVKDGWAVFMDCDVMARADIAELMDLADPKYAVMVVKHGHVPDVATKMQGCQNQQYNRKGWSSVTLWNCEHKSNKRLTLAHLNSWPGRDLHAFRWLEDCEIGELPPEWNVLVDQGTDPEGSKILHFTLGGPWFDGWVTINKAAEQLWLGERDRT